MKSFRTQFCECHDAGLLNKTVFLSFDEHPDYLPAFPSKEMVTALKSGEWKGIDLFVCGRFGGICSGKHPDCYELRLRKDIDAPRKI